MAVLSLRAPTHPNYSLAESHVNVLCCCVTTTEDLSPYFPVLGLFTPGTLETPKIFLTLTVLVLFFYIYYCIELELFTMNYKNIWSGVMGKIM